MVLELKEKRSNGLLIGIRDETRFSFEEWKMVQEYDESIEGLASIFSKFSVPQKENANIMVSESTIGKSTINRNIEELIEECKIGKYDDIRKHGSSPCYAIDDDVVLVHHKNSEDSKIFAEFFKSLSDEDKKNIFKIIYIKYRKSNRIYNKEKPENIW